MTALYCSSPACFQWSDVADGQISPGRLEKVDDIGPVARQHSGGADHDCGDDRPIDDAEGARLSEDPPDAVRGVRVQFGNLTPTKQAMKLSLAG
jgi:hypothetical protein